MTAPTLAPSSVLAEASALMQVHPPAPNRAIREAMATLLKVADESPDLTELADAAHVLAEAIVSTDADRIARLDAHADQMAARR